MVPVGWTVGDRAKINGLYPCVSRRPRQNGRVIGGSVCGLCVRIIWEDTPSRPVECIAVKFLDKFPLARTDRQAGE